MPKADLVSVKAAAEILDIREDSCRKLIRAGKLASVRIGHRRWVPRSSLEERAKARSKKEYPNILEMFRYQRYLDYLESLE